MVNKWRVILVDDEPLARLGLKISLTRRHLDFEVVGEAESAAEALKLIEQDPAIDGLFLDIHIQTESERAGLDFAFSLSHRVDPPWIVFVTGYEKHALEAHEMHSVGYLVKPLEDAKVDKVLDWIRKNRPLKKQSRIDIRHRTTNRFGEKEWHTEFVDPNDILYIHKNNAVATVRVLLVRGTVLDGINSTLRAWETQDGFCKINRSCIVNPKQGRSLMSPQDGSDVCLLTFWACEDRLIVGQEYKESLIRALKK